MESIKEELLEELLEEFPNELEVEIIGGILVSISRGSFKIIP